MTETQELSQTPAPETPPVTESKSIAVGEKVPFSAQEFKNQRLTGKSHEELGIIDNKTQKELPNPPTLREDATKTPQSKTQTPPDKKVNLDTTHLEERLKQNRSYATRLTTRLDQAEKQYNEFQSGLLNKIDQLVQDAEITEDNGKVIKDFLKGKTVDFSKDIPPEETPKSEYEKKVQSVTGRLTPDHYNIFEEVSGDSKYFEKIHAFDDFLSEQSEQKRDEIITELQNLDSPMKVIRRIVEYGKSHMEGDYGEVLKQGGYKAYIKDLKSKLEKTTKDLESTRKHLSQYEDFDERTPILETGTHQTGIRSLESSSYSDNDFSAESFKRRRLQQR